MGENKLQLRLLHSCHRSQLSSQLGLKLISFQLLLQHVHAYQILLLKNVIFTYDLPFMLLLLGCVHLCYLHMRIVL